MIRIEEMLFYTDAMKLKGKTKKAFQKYENIDFRSEGKEIFEAPCIFFSSISQKDL